MSANIDHLKEEHHQPSGLMRWITTTNHKDIGSLYLWFSLLMFFVGGLMALVIRAELFQPGLQFVVPGFFNQMTTMHALIMIFGAVMQQRRDYISIDSVSRQNSSLPSNCLQLGMFQECTENNPPRC